MTLQFYTDNSNFQFLNRKPVFLENAPYIITNFLHFYTKSWCSPLFLPQCCWCGFLTFIPSVLGHTVIHDIIVDHKYVWHHFICVIKIRRTPEILKNVASTTTISSQPNVRYLIHIFLVPKKVQKVRHDLCKYRQRLFYVRWIHFTTK